MVRRRERQDPGRDQPRHRQAHRPRRPRRHRRPRPRARRRAARLRSLAQDPRQRARSDHAQGCRPGARTRRRHRPPAHPGAGQALRRSPRRSARRRRHHRMVRRRRPPRLWPHRALAQPGRAAARHQGAARPRGRVHALELPDQPDRAQAGRRARERLLVPGQGAGGNAGFSRGAAAGLRGCGRARGHGGPGVRRSGGDLELPDPASDHPQGDFHRLDAGGQAARGAGRCAHEARDHGAGRPRAGDRGRGRRCRAGGEGFGRRPSSATRARCASRRRAFWCTTASSRRLPRRW